MFVQSHVPGPRDPCGLKCTRWKSDRRSRRVYGRETGPVRGGAGKESGWKEETSWGKNRNPESSLRRRDPREGPRVRSQNGTGYEGTVGLEEMTQKNPSGQVNRHGDDLHPFG